VRSPYVEPVHEHGHSLARVGVTDTDVMQPGPVAKRELAALVDQVPSAAEADLDEAGVVLADAFSQTDPQEWITSGTSAPRRSPACPPSAVELRPSDR
jgi:hypothetical protein